MDYIINTEILRRGIKVECPKCKHGILLPYNTTPEKAHSYNCSNLECDQHINLDMVIDIE